MAKIPDIWLSTPPRNLVIENGSYSHVITGILGASCLSATDLPIIEFTNLGTAIPRVFSELKCVILVANRSESPAEVLNYHEAIWKWIEALSPDGDMHELVMLVIVPAELSERFIEALLMKWGITLDEAKSFGLGFATMGDSLESLCQTLAETTAMDLLPLRARQAKDVRHKSIRLLLDAQTFEDFSLATKQVSELFKGSEYHLDLFCQPPAHSNGNRLRSLLSEIVTESVTPDILADHLKEICDLLR